VPQRGSAGGAVDELEQRRRDRIGCRRAARDAQIDGEHGVDRPDEGIGCAEEVTAEGTVAERSDQTRLRHRLVGSEEWVAHAGGDRPGHEQQIGVSRRRDDAEPESLEVVVRARGEGELVLAPVAGANIDVTDREAAAVIGPRKRTSAAESSEVAEQGQHQRSAQA